MDPILRGKVSVISGHVVWEGVWSTTGFPHGDETVHPKFRYESMEKLNTDAIQAGTKICFQGYFEMPAAAPSKTGTRFTEKKFEIALEKISASASTSSSITSVDSTTEIFEKVDSPATDSGSNDEDQPTEMDVQALTSMSPKTNVATLRATGLGINRFGAFGLIGTYDPISNILEITRTYNRLHRTVSSSQTKSEETARSQALILGTLQNVQADLSFMTDARSLLNELRVKDVNQWFSSPVDAQALGLFDYHGIIKQPMDFGTVELKLNAKQYARNEECVADIRLTFFNALLYNPRGSPVYRAAQELTVFLDDRASDGAVVQDPAAVPATIGKRSIIKKKFADHVEYSGKDGSMYFPVDELALKTALSRSKSTNSSSSRSLPTSSSSVSKGKRKAAATTLGSTRGATAKAQADAASKPGKRKVSKKFEFAAESSETEYVPMYFENLHDPIKFPRLHDPMADLAASVANQFEDDDENASFTGDFDQVNDDPVAVEDLEQDGASEHGVSSVAAAAAATSDATADDSDELRSVDGTFGLTPDFNAVASMLPPHDETMMLPDAILNDDRMDLGHRHLSIANNF